MNFVISIINNNALKIMNSIVERLNIPIVLSLIGKGTVSQSIRDMWGLESNEKRIVITVATDKKTKELIDEQKKRLYIDAPGNGIVIAVPVKSIGGQATLSLISQGEKIMKKAPVIDPENELIVIIANEGHTDTVMDIARAAGAGGGTVIHAKGTGGNGQEKFFSVSIAEEKEVIIIVAAQDKKADIMKAVIEKAGAATDAGAIAFSLPVSELAGFSTKHQD